MWKMSRTLKVSSSAVAETIKRDDETGSHEDCHRKGRPRVPSATEDKFIRVTSLRYCRPNKCFRVQVTDTSYTSTVERGLRESGLLGLITAKKPLLKDTNNKRLAWAKKTQAMDIRLMEICPLV
jgi:transposase